MNAAVRAVVRSAIHFNYSVEGVRFGFKGLIEGDFIELSSSDMSGIIQTGGTILKSARSQEFLNEEGRAEAARQLKEKGIEALIVISGDGTFQGATLLSQENDMIVVGGPATMEHDIIGAHET